VRRETGGVRIVKYQSVMAPNPLNAKIKGARLSRLKSIVTS
jgi:hypothetical protein